MDSLVLTDEMREYIDLVVQTAIKDPELIQYAKEDPRLATVLGRGLKEAEDKSAVIQRLKVNSIVNWYSRLLAKEVKAVQ